MVMWYMYISNIYYCLCWSWSGCWWCGCGWAARNELLRDKVPLSVGGSGQRAGNVQCSLYIINWAHHHRHLMQQHSNRFSQRRQCRPAPARPEPNTNGLQINHPPPNMCHNSTAVSISQVSPMNSCVSPLVRSDKYFVSITTCNPN